MATSQQLEANRHNALASTGPRTEAGKAVVRLNNYRHGLRCDLPVIEGVEQEADWLDHLEGIRASLAPANPLEDALAARVAMMLWRLNRVARYETAMIGVGQEKAGEAVRKVDHLDTVIRPERPAVRLKAALKSQEQHDEASGGAETALAALEALAGPKASKVTGGQAWWLLDAARDVLGLEVDFEDEDFLTGVGAGDFDEDWTVGMLQAALARLAGFVRKRRRGEKPLTDRVREHLVTQKEEERKSARRLARDVREAEEAVAAEERQARLRRLMPEDAVLQSISRYETHLEKGLSRTLEELHRLQAVRARQRGPGAVVLEMSGGGQDCTGG